MNRLYRYNRPKGLKAVTVSLSESEITLVLLASVPDESFTGLGEFPMIASEPITLSLSVADLVALRGFDSGAMMILDVGKLVSGEPAAWQNIFVSTYVGRRSVREAVYETDINAAVRVLVPSKHITSLLQCKWMFCMADASCPLQANAEIVQLESADQFISEQFCPIIYGPETISPAGTATFTVQLQSSEGDVMSLPADIYLEATAGVLNRARVPLNTSGAGEFEINSFGLLPGDQIKLKSGFRYFPGAFEKIVNVV